MVNRFVYIVIEGTGGINILLIFILKFNREPWLEEWAQLDA